MKTVQITKQGRVFTGSVRLGNEALEGTDIEPGLYVFDEDGKMQLKNGIVDGKYYIDSVLQKSNKVVKVDGDYYYVRANGSVYVGTIGLGAEKLEGTPLGANTYEFGEDGKMVMNNGIINGKYYENGQIKKLGKVIELGGDYYYVSKQGAIYKGTVALSAAQLSNTTFAPGRYTFGTDGKMIIA